VVRSSLAAAALCMPMSAPLIAKNSSLQDMVFRGKLEL
jgi:hypothetical protein